MFVTNCEKLENPYILHGHKTRNTYGRQKATETNGSTLSAISRCLWKQYYDITSRIQNSELFYYIMC